MSVVLLREQNLKIRLRLQQKIVWNQFMNRLLSLLALLDLEKYQNPFNLFLEVNHQYIRGVAASGNRNWGLNFAKAGRTISEEYNVPLLMKFELHGKNKDVIEFKNKVGNFNENHGREKVQSY